MSSAPGSAQPWQDANGLWYFLANAGQFSQTMRSPGGPTVAEQYDTGAEERHPAKIQELCAGEQSTEVVDDWFKQQE